MAKNFGIEVTELTSKMVKESIKDLTQMEAANLVRLYYQMQDDRISGKHRIRKHLELTKTEPLILKFLADQAAISEAAVKMGLEAFSNANPICQKLREIYGIGPVIAAGIVAQIDITKSPTAGHIESFAGFNPMVKWVKGEKRPWNATLKQVFFHAGSGFFKFMNRRECFYGQVLRSRLIYEIDRNERGENAKYAEANKHRFSPDTVSYQCMNEGKLNKLHLINRARRITLKIFISHMFEWWYEEHYGRAPADHYIFAIKKHVHRIPNPFKDPVAARVWSDRIFDSLAVSEDIMNTDIDLLPREDDWR